MNIIGTAIQSGDGKLVTCAHVAEALQMNKSVVTSSLLEVYQKQEYTQEDIEQAAFSVINAIQPLFMETDILAFARAVLEHASKFLEVGGLFRLPCLIEQKTPETS